MVGNLALKKNVNDIVTAGGVCGFDSLAAIYPADLTPVSGSGAMSITLPPARLTSTALGGGQGQVLAFQNLAAFGVTLVAASGDTVVNNTSTIAQNATAVLVADANNNRWYRIQG